MFFRFILKNRKSKNENLITNDTIPSNDFVTEESYVQIKANKDNIKLDSEIEQEECDNYEIQIIDAYKMLGIDVFPISDAEVKQIYYQKRQDVRQYKLKNENKILLDLKRAYEIILAKPENFSYQNEIIEKNIIQNEVDEPNKTLENNVELNDELYSWDDLMQNIESKNNNKSKRKKVFIISMFISLVILISIFAGLVEKNQKTLINQNSPIKENEIESSLCSSQYKIGHGQKVTIEQEDILSIDNLWNYYIPLFRYYFQESSFIAKKGALTCKAECLTIYRYYETSTGETHYVPVKVIQKSCDANIDIVGTWTGIYKASDKNELDYTVKITIKEENDGKLSGICNITADNGKEGSYLVEVTVYDALNVSIVGTEWINKPTFFIMSDFNAFYDIQNEILLPSTKKGSIFSLEKEIP